MSRYVPTAGQQAAIDELKVAGYTTVRQRTYTDLLERVRVAEIMEAYAKERVVDVQAWAGAAFDEQRRLSNRLNKVCLAAAALGVSIRAINDALDEADAR